MNAFRTAVQAWLFKLGYQLRRTSSLGRNPFSDVKQFVPTSARPLILDVGANTGQSVANFKEIFPASTIHSFEPSRETFQKLSQNIAGQETVFPWNFALGASTCQQVFFENTHSDMSSFLEPDKTSWGEIAKESTIEVVTLDRFLEAQQIAFVDILKSDTQGYELEVFKGAEEAMRMNRIGLVYFEFIFSEMYKKLPPFDEVYRYLKDRNFLLVSICDLHYRNRLASWGDLLFVNKEYYARTA